MVARTPRQQRQRWALAWWWLGVVLSFGLCGLGFGIILRDVIRCGEFGYYGG